jgi:hypothetical protein
MCVKSLGIRQNLLVVLRAKEEYDPLAALFNRCDRTMKLVQSAKVSKQIARKLGEVDTTNRETADEARIAHARPLEELVGNDGHQKPSKDVCRFRQARRPTNPWSASSASEHNGVKETLAFFNVVVYQD